MISTFRLDGLLRRAWCRHRQVMNPSIRTVARTEQAAAGLREIASAK
ncbi:hypothetical protein ACP4IX_17510 [Streptomyces sp. WG5]